jgi:hypothetical protein
MAKRQLTRSDRLARRKRRRWLKFWEKHWKPLPAFHTMRTIERLVADDYRCSIWTTDEYVVWEGVRFIESRALA